VRELENMIERAIVIGNGKEIKLKDLPLAKEAIAADSNDSLYELEKKYVQKTLNKNNWNISQSARALKIDRVTLYNKIKKYGLKSPKRGN
jgi:DNA-binding NtrC family response regulator